MLVLNTTSPKVSPAAPKPCPVKTVPSSRASFAITFAIRSSPPPSEPFPHCRTPSANDTSRRTLVRRLTAGLPECHGSRTQPPDGETGLDVDGDDDRVTEVRAVEVAEAERHHAQEAARRRVGEGAIRTQRQA